MERRQYVRALGTVGVLSVSGCLGDDGPISSASGDDPTDVLAEFDTAWEESDGESIDEIVHTESPWRDDEWWLDNENFGPLEDTEWAIEEREINDQSESEATVQEVSVWDYPNQEPERLTIDWELRTEDNEWKIWDSETTTTETLDETPDSLS